MHGNHSFAKAFQHFSISFQLTLMKNVNLKLQEVPVLRESGSIYGKYRNFASAHQIQPFFVPFTFDALIYSNQKYHHFPIAFPPNRYLIALQLFSHL